MTKRDQICEARGTPRKTVFAPGKCSVTNAGRAVHFGAAGTGVVRVVRVGVLLALTIPQCTGWPNKTMIAG